MNNSLKIELLFFYFRIILVNLYANSMCNVCKFWPMFKYTKDSVSVFTVLDTRRPWKIQCKLPPKTKRFCPLKTFNNAPLKSLDRWGYYYFRFFSVWLNRLRNKLLANYLRNRGNDLATVRISVFCVAMLSNNSFICKYNIFFRKYEVSVAIL